MANALGEEPLAKAARCCEGRSPSLCPCTTAPPTTTPGRARARARIRVRYQIQFPGHAVAIRRSHCSPWLHPVERAALGVTTRIPYACLDGVAAAAVAARVAGGAVHASAGEVGVARAGIVGAAAAALPSVRLSARGSHCRVERSGHARVHCSWSAVGGSPGPLVGRRWIGFRPVHPAAPVVRHAQAGAHSSRA